MQPILVYYWLTPAFWLVDEFLGANFRTAALEGHTFWKAAYYVFCIGIAFAASVFPDWMARLGLLEARINIALLVIGLFVPLYRFIYDDTGGEMPTEPPITMAKMANFVLAAAIWGIALRMRRASK